MVELKSTSEVEFGAELEGVSEGVLSTGSMVGLGSELMIGSEVELGTVSGTELAMRDDDSTVAVVEMSVGPAAGASMPGLVVGRGTVDGSEDTATLVVSSKTSVVEVSPCNSSSSSC